MNKSNNSLYSNFRYHFFEFKLRLRYVVLSLVLNFLTCYYYYFEIIYIFTKPFLKYEKSFIFIDLTEAFYTSIQVSYFFSLYLVVFLLVYQIWCFFIPSKFKNERKNINFLFFSIIIILVLSVMFVYVIILPNLYNFLLNFQIQNSLVNIELEARIKSYVELACKIFILFSFIFELPLMFLMLIKTNKLQMHFFIKNRLKIFFCILILSSLLSPPDVFTQIILSFFLQFILEILIFISFFLKNFESFLTAARKSRNKKLIK